MTVGHSTRYRASRSSKKKSFRARKHRFSPSRSSPSRKNRKHRFPPSRGAGDIPFIPFIPFIPPIPPEPLTTSECAVCLDSFDNDACTPFDCTHPIHLPCAETWTMQEEMNHSRRCPTCRKPEKKHRLPADQFDLAVPAGVVVLAPTSFDDMMSTLRSLPPSIDVAYVNSSPAVVETSVLVLNTADHAMTDVQQFQLARQLMATPRIHTIVTGLGNVNLAEIRQSTNLGNLMHYDPPVNMLSLSRAVDATPNTLVEADINTSSFTDWQWELVVYVVQRNATSLQTLKVSMMMPKIEQNPVTASRFVSLSMPSLVELTIAWAYVDAIPLDNLPNVVKLSLQHADWYRPPSPPVVPFVLPQLHKLKELTLDSVDFDNVSFDRVPNVDKLRIVGLNCDKNRELALRTFKSIRELNELKDLALVDFTSWNRSTAVRAMQHLIEIVPKLTTLEVENCGALFSSKVMVIELMESIVKHRISDVFFISNDITEVYRRWRKKKGGEVKDYCRVRWVVKEEVI